MSRKRIIDTELLYFDTELYEILGDRGLLLYVRLWGIAEDSGVYTPNYSDIALKLGALKFSNEEVKNHIKKLIKTKKIVAFHENKKEYHWLKNFLKHQSLNNSPPPKLPLPKWLKCDYKKYKSGKEYVQYSIILSELPVALRVITSNSSGITGSLPRQNTRIDTMETNIETIIDTLSPLPPRGSECCGGEVVDGGNGSGDIAEKDKGDILIQRFNIFKQTYPKWSKEPIVEQLFYELAPDEKLFSKIVSSIEILKKSEEWKRESGRFIPSPENFLRNQRWEDRPPQSFAQATQPVYVSTIKDLSPEKIQKFDQARANGLEKIKTILKLPTVDTS